MPHGTTPRIWVASDDVAAPQLTELLQALETLGQARCASERDADAVLFVSQSVNEVSLRRLEELNARGSRVVAIVLAEAGAEPYSTRTLIEAGATDAMVCRSPVECAPRVLARLQRWQSIDDSLRAASSQGLVVGQSAIWRGLLYRVVEATLHSQAPILLLGESGTGKEQLARLVHQLDPRAGKRAMVTLDCAAIVPELSGSEFFGHERGAYTGATGPRDGAFAEADGGTLFLDEVGELPLALQARLLRVIQEGTYKRLGGNGWHETHFRLVSATNRHLNSDVQDNKFRLDFLHRIGGFTLRVPRLAERGEDILLLARHFAAQQLGNSDIELDDELQGFLLERPYPGNVRELKQLVTRACARYVGGKHLSLADLPEEEVRSTSRTDVHGDMAAVTSRAVVNGTGLKELLRLARQNAIQAALTASDRNIQRAAKLLKVTDRALQMELAKPEN